MPSRGGVLFSERLDRGRALLSHRERHSEEKSFAQPDQFFACASPEPSVLRVVKGSD